MFPHRAISWKLPYFDCILFREIKADWPEPPICKVFFLNSISSKFRCDLWRLFCSILDETVWSVKRVDKNKASLQKFFLIFALSQQVYRIQKNIQILIRPSHKLRSTSKLSFFHFHLKKWKHNVFYKASILSKFIHYLINDSIFKTSGVVLIVQPSGLWCKYCTRVRKSCPLSWSSN